LVFEITMTPAVFRFDSTLGGATWSVYVRRPIRKVNWRVSLETGFGLGVLILGANEITLLGMDQTLPQHAVQKGNPPNQFAS
jgi:hypothetical protein